MAKHACIHHWLLERPSDCGTSKAVCGKCGEERDFLDGVASRQREHLRFPSREDENRLHRDYLAGYQ
jgi:hypothetical protein